MKETTTTTISNSLSDGINSLFSNLFSSLDNNIYAILDDLTFIDGDIYTDNSFAVLLSKSPTTGILLIANSLILGFLIFYSLKLLLSSFYIINNLEKPSQFIFKLLFCAFFMNFSFDFCELLINFTSILSSSLRSLGESIFNCNMDFSTLVTNINIVLSFNSSIDIFSLDGVLKSIISVGFFNLIFTYSLRYIMIRVFILLSPFATISLCHNSTSFIFKIWLKSFISLLFIQILISVILLITFTIVPADNMLLSKILYIGSIFALTKSNNYMKEIIGGISTTVNTNIASLSAKF